MINLEKKRSVLPGLLRENLQVLQVAPAPHIEFVIIFVPGVGRTVGLDLGVGNRPYAPVLVAALRHADLEQARNAGILVFSSSSVKHEVHKLIAPESLQHMDPAEGEQTSLDFLQGPGEGRETYSKSSEVVVLIENHDRSLVAEKVEY